MGDEKPGLPDSLISDDDHGRSSRAEINGLADIILALVGRSSSTGGDAPLAPNRIARLEALLAAIKKEAQTSDLRDLLGSTSLHNRPASWLVGFLFANDDVFDLF